MQQRAVKQPIFNAPTVVIALIGLLIAIHVIRWGLGEDTDNWLIGAFALIPARLTGLAEQLPGGTAAIFTSPISHMLVHGSGAHLIFNALWLLAFGSVIAARIGTWRFLGYCLLTGFAGAVLFCLLNWGQIIPVIGASGAVSGLFGGVSRFLFRAIDYGSLQILQQSPRAVPLMTLRETFTDHRVLILIGVWLFLNLLGFFGLSGVEGGGDVAWEAHVGGFAAGILTFGWFDDIEPKQRKKRPNLRVVH